MQGGGTTRNPAFLIFGQDPQEHLFCFLPKPGQKSETSGLPLTCWVRRLLAQFSPVIIYEGWKSVPVVNERGNCRPAMNCSGCLYLRYGTPTIHGRPPSPGSTAFWPECRCWCGRIIPAKDEPRVDTFAVHCPCHRDEIRPKIEIKFCRNTGLNIPWPGQEAGGFRPSSHPPHTVRATNRLRCGQGEGPQAKRALTTIRNPVPSIH